MRKLDEFAPVGRDLKTDFTFYFIGLGVAVLVALSYPLKLWGAFYSASQGEVAVMEPFVSVLGWCLAIFPLLALFCLSYIAIYYQMHLPSLYLMRRLPDRWSLCRRCVVIPLTMAVVTMVIAGLLLLIFYWLYCAVTPDGYFVEGQLKMLVGAWFRGESQWTT